MKRILFVLCTLLFMSTTVFAESDTVRINTIATSIYTGTVDSPYTNIIATTDWNGVDWSGSEIDSCYINLHFNNIFTREGELVGCLPDTASYMYLHTDEGEYWVKWNDSIYFNLISDSNGARYFYGGNFDTTQTHIFKFFEINISIDTGTITTTDNVTIGCRYDIMCTNMEVIINGCESTDIITIYDMSGRVVKSIRSDGDGVIIRGLNRDMCYIAHITDYITHKHKGTVKFVFTPR